MKKIVKKIELGYAFVPLPQWIEAEWEAGRMTDEVERLHRILYRRANLQALSKRQPSVEISADVLASTLVSTTDAARKLLQRERQRGHLDYALRGSPKHGYVFVITLFVDGPVPVPRESRSPTRTESRRQRGRKSLAGRRPGATGAARVPKQIDAEHGDESRKDVVESRSGDGSKPPAESDPGRDSAARVPNVQTSPETPRSEGTNREVLGKTTRGRERARSNETRPRLSPQEQAAADQELKQQAVERTQAENGWVMVNGIPVPAQVADHVEQTLFDMSKPKPETAP